MFSRPWQLITQIKDTWTIELSDNKKYSHELF
jgi:hypothetical protein